MMTLKYHSFPLKCYPALKEETLNFMKEFNVKDFYAKAIPISSELKSIFNEEMYESGLTGAVNFLCFKRKNHFSEMPNEFVHIDYSNQYDYRLHTAINIPVEGCDNTSIFWLDGNYDTVKKSSFYNYLEINWHGDPIVSDRVEINKEPMLIRTDTPHNVTSNKDGSYRTMLSIRLIGNPTFEEILQKKFNYS